MSPGTTQSTTQGLGLPTTLLPLLSASLNVGLALGAYVTTLPFADPKYPGPAIVIWFEKFFRPGFIAITTLAATTVGGGLRSWWLHRNKPGDRGSTTVSRWALAGLVFTIFHFGFGNQVLAIMDNILFKPDTAQSEMTKWIKMHIFRAFVADVPAWVCFIAALLSEI